MLSESGNKTAAASRTIITELMMPHHGNFEGKINAGVLLTLMDQVAFTCATRHAGNFCVTVSIEEVEFFHPVNVGDLITVMASVNYVGNTSLIIGVRVESENIKTGYRTHTNTSYFTMVAKDERGRPMQVPGLVLEDMEDVRRFMEAIIRKQAKLQGKISFESRIKDIDIIRDLSKLKRERCEITFDIEL